MVPRPEFLDRTPLSRDPSLHRAVRPGHRVRVVVIVTWFVILFTGRYPRTLFDFVEGVIRWHNRVLGYAFLLVTDRYPPFRLGP